VAVFLVTSALFAETTLPIEVRDSHGAPLAGAVVEIRSGAVLLTSNPAPEGKVAIPEPSPGDYVVAVRYHDVT
jgi:hypothetical protein